MSAWFRYIILSYRVCRQYGFAAWRKSAQFNFACFEKNVARKLPVLISAHTVLKNIEGKVTLASASAYHAMIRIGFGEVSIFDKETERTIIELKKGGEMYLGEKINLGHGTRISVGEKGILKLGDRFSVTAKSSIVCQHAVSIGSDCLFSWDVLVMDTDFHSIYHEDKLLPKSGPVQIDDRVWIGARAVILKNTSIPKDSIIAAGSMVTKKFEQPGILIGGNPATVIRENMKWEH